MHWHTQCNGTLNAKHRNTRTRSFNHWWMHWLEYPCALYRLHILQDIRLINCQLLNAVPMDWELWQNEMWIDSLRSHFVVCCYATYSSPWRMPCFFFHFFGKKFQSDSSQRNIFFSLAVRSASIIYSSECNAMLDKTNIRFELTSIKGAWEEMKRNRNILLAQTGWLAKTSSFVCIATRNNDSTNRRENCMRSVPLFLRIGCGGDLWGDALLTWAKEEKKEKQSRIYTSFAYNNKYSINYVWACCVLCVRLRSS